MKIGLIKFFWCSRASHDCAPKNLLSSPISNSNFKIFLLWICVIFIMGLVYKFVKSDSLIQVIYQSLPPKEAGLLAGIILGDKTGFDKTFWEQLKRSGIVHVVVVSGTNVIILTSLIVENLAVILGRKKAIILALILAFSYVNLVGWQIPVIRAVILIGIYYWAQLLGRKYSIGRSLILTIIIMLLADPKMILEISFWLSFLAFIAVISELKNNEKGFNNIKSTLWVSLFITPILSFSFGTISIISFLSNAMLIGLVEIITIIGGIGAIIGVFCNILGHAFLLLIYPLLKYFVVIVEVLGNLSWASIDFKFNYFILIGWYLVLGVYLLKRKNEV